MYMSFSPSVITFLISVLFGMIFGLIWNINLVIKKNSLKKPSKNLVIFLDIIFCIIVSILTISFFFKYTYSGFRIFVLIGELIGFTLYFCTIEKILTIIINFTVKLIFSLYRNTIKTFLISLINFLTNNLKNIIIFILKNKILKSNLKSLISKKQVIKKMDRLNELKKLKR